MKHLEKARKLAPNLFKDSSSTVVRYRDSFLLRTRDSVIYKEKVTITGETIIICDTIEGKARPFRQTASTGLVNIEFWIDTAGQFHYRIDQDSIVSRFKDLEQRMTASKDSIRDNYIMVPKIVYQVNWQKILLSGAIGVAIGFLLLGLFRLFFKGTWSALKSKLPL